MSKKLIKVGATWCGKCKILDKRLPKVKEQFNVVSLDVEKDFEEVEKLPKIKTLPIMFIIEDDQVIETITGLATAEELIEKLS